MTDKYLSIITNFGCHFTCPYCVVKNNHLDIPVTTLDGLKHLKEAIEFEKANIISVSGGGDPLHEYVLHRNYYRELFNVCEELNLPLEMHTSYIRSKFPYKKCYRVVYHCRSIEQVSTIVRHGNEIVRVVFVVTADFTPELIDAIAEYVKSSDIIDELSFRQMIDKGYTVTNYCQEYLRSGHKDRWWYIEQGDYNSYFVNGEIFYKYSEIASHVYGEEVEDE